jgi:hypothetical protein
LLTAAAAAAAAALSSKKTSQKAGKKADQEVDHETDKKINRKVQAATIRVQPDWSKFEAKEAEQTKAVGEHEKDDTAAVAGAGGQLVKGAASTDDVEQKTPGELQTTTENKSAGNHPQDQGGQ